MDGLYYILKKDDLKNLNGMLRRQPEPEPEEPPYKDIWAEMRAGCKNPPGVNYTWASGRIAVGLEKDEGGSGLDGKRRKPNPGDPIPEFVRPIQPRPGRGRYCTTAAPTGC